MAERLNSEGSLEIAHLLWEQRVAGSNPVIPTILHF